MTKIKCTGGHSRDLVHFVSDSQFISENRFIMTFEIFTESVSLRHIGSDELAKPIPHTKILETYEIGTDGLARFVEANC